MRRALSLFSWMFLAFVGVNMLYEVKCMMNIDLLPGHYGLLFPLKDWVHDALYDNQTDVDSPSKDSNHSDSEDTKSDPQDD